MRRAAVLTAIILAITAFPSFSQVVDQLSAFSRQPELVKLEIRFDDAGPSGDVRGTVVIAIEPAWHINSVRPIDEFAIPTLLTFESDVLEVGRFEFPPHVERKFSFSTGKLAVYEGAFEVPFVAVKKAASGSVTARLRYQACDDKVCLPPRDVAVTVAYPSNETAVPSRPSSSVESKPAGGAFQKLEDAPPTGAPRSGGGLFSTDIAGSLATRGLALTLLTVFLLGLGLNLTPCVYPLIPITLAYFSSQTEGKRSRQIALSTAYVLGLAVTYSALGVFAALSGKLFGAWLQLPAVLIFFAILMLVLAASMFGVYDIRVPQFIAGKAGARVGIPGAVMMGLLAGIVAAPCVGPFIISLIALVGQSGDVSLGILLFFVLALGLGFPYLLLGIFSTALTAMPRSGEWMVQVKKAMGFILIAMAFYFLRPLTGDEIYKWGVGLSLLAGAGFLIARKSAAGSGSMVRYLCAALLLAGGLWFLVPRSAGPEIEWKPYNESALAAAAAAGRPVMIDFYADWCLPCKELDHKTFNQESVVLESTRFVRLKADLTLTSDEATKALSREYAILGVPTIVFIDPAGREISSLRLVGFEDAEKFLARMKNVE